MRELKETSNEDNFYASNGMEVHKWQWDRNDIPKLFSPLNRAKYIKQRRLLCLISKYTNVGNTV